MVVIVAHMVGEMLIFSQYLVFNNGSLNTLHSCFGMYNVSSQIGMSGMTSNKSNTSSLDNGISSEDDCGAA